MVQTTHKRRNSHKPGRGRRPRRPEKENVRKYILAMFALTSFYRVILSGVKRSRTFGRTCASKSKSHRLAGISDGILPNHFLGKNIFFAQKGITHRHYRSHRRCRSSVLLACFAAPRKTSTPHRRWRRSAQDDTKTDRHGR